MTANAWHRPARVATALLLVGIMVRCDTDPHVDGHSVTSQPPELSIREVVRIDGDVEDLVPLRARRGYHDVALALDGSIAALQPQDNAVLLFDSAGQRLGSFGRPGAGPGEFRALNHLGWVSDSLWIYDGFLHRLSIVAPDLSLVRTTSIPANAAVNGDPSGTLRISLPYAVYSDSSVLVSAEDESRGVLALLDLRTNRATVLATTWELPDLHRVVASNGAVNTANPFPDFLPAYTTSPNGHALAVVRTDLDAKTFTVSVLTERADTLMNRTYSFEPIPLSKAVADSVIEASTAPTRAISPELADLYVESAFVPSVYPPIRDVRLGNDGALWIQLFSESRNRSYWVLDSLGNVMGRVELPDRTEAVSVSRASAWAIAQDTLGVPSFVRYAIQY